MTIIVTSVSLSITIIIIIISVDWYLLNYSSTNLFSVLSTQPVV